MISSPVRVPPHLVAVLLSLQVLLQVSVGHAQMTLDGSLGPAGPLTGPDFVIDSGLGQIRGSNLFHSFGQFNVQTGESATFTGPGSIANILSRVTGGQQSMIDGLLRSTIPGANLFLINPKGVIFGPNATLDITGSLRVTTADYLRLADGARFHADLSRESLLTTAQPVAFGFLGATAGPISVDGAILAVPEGRTLSLIGGDIRITFATLNAPSGRVEIASVASAGEVIPNPPGQPPGLDVSSFSSLGRIDLDGALLDASDLSGIGGGTVLVRGGRLIVIGSSIMANTAGDVDGAAVGVDLALADEISLDGSTVTTFSGDFATETGEGSAGDVTLDARTVAITGGSAVGTVSLFGGPTGNVTVTATESISVSGRSVFEEPSSIFASASGNGGRLSISTPSLSIDDGATITSSTLAGETGGGIEVAVRRLSTTNGATISSVAGGNAPGGSVTVTATDSATISGVGSDGSPSGIFSGSCPGCPGRAGDIVVDTGTFSLTGRALIQNGSDANPQGGNVSVTGRTSMTIAGGSGISIQAASQDIGQVEISTPLLSMDNGFIRTSTIGDFSAGDILANVGTLLLNGGAQIISSSEILATGPGGSITINASEPVAISGTAASGVPVTPFINDTSSGLFSTAQGSGAAGTITVSAPILTMSDGGRISASSTGTSEALGGASPGAAGSITIGRADGAYATKQVWLSGAEITAFAKEGPTAGEAREGNIAISADELIVLRGGSSVTSSVEEGLGGDISIEGADLLVLEGGSAILAETRNGTGGAISLSTDGVVPQLARVGSSALVSAGFVPGVSGGRISADAGAGTSGTISTTSPEVDIESQVTALDVAFLETQGISSVCAARASGETGSFQIARYRGLPASPEDLLLAFDDGDQVGLHGVPGAKAAAEENRAPATAAMSALSAGSVALREGKASVAEEHFAKASEALGADGDAGLRSDALRGLGQAQQAQGHFGEARDTLQAALALAQQAGDPAREAAVSSHLGATQVAMREPLEAERVLVRGLDVAKKSGDSGLTSRLEIDLGNAHAAQQEWQEAFLRYEAAAAGAHAAGRTEQEATALVSAARAAIDARELERAKPLLFRAEAALEPLSGLAAVHLGIHLGKSFTQLAELETGAPARVARLRQAYGQLQAAAAGAEARGDARLRSFALGNLGALYEAEHRSAEALYLTRQALAQAEAAEAPDALYRWHWQEGRILWSLGQAEPALASLRRAVEIIEATRQVSLAHYGSAALHFQRAVAPVYRDYIEALLRGSELVAANPAASRRLLDEARATMEQSQAAELRDYFRDECVADIEARTLDLDRVLREKSPKTAVVYPIALEKRLELLVSLPGGAERFAVAVSAGELDAATKRFRDALTDRTSRRYAPLAEQLHRWLVAPYEARLREEGIETLVFVPGGSLRTIPLGALHDGERFLLEKYALAVTPGLSLVDPRALDAREGRFLLAGLSTGGTFGGKTFDTLPQVTQEIGAIRKLYGGDVLLDAGFEGARFQKAVVEGEPTVVHVASHAYFGSGPDESFLLTHDGAVTFDQLGDVIGPRRYTRAPLELLVLSACRTAAGDERAALGLAGVAIRSGARSAVGSLWAISDEAGYEVMTGFYEALGKPQVSKAKALQQAQLALLRPDSAYRHPFYWSPYLLISNWL